MTEQEDRGRPRAALERTLGFALVAAFVLLTSVPHALAYWRTPAQTQHRGIFIADPDVLSHQAWVIQAMQGRLLWTNHFSPDRDPPHVFNPLWLAIGALCAVFQLRPDVGMELARILGALAAALAAWLLLRRLLRDPLARLGALALTLFTGGLGWIWVFYRVPGAVPADIGILEFVPFVACALYTQLPWAHAFLWGGLALAHRAAVEAHWPSALLAALLFVVLAGFHPFDLLTALAVLSCLLLPRQRSTPLGKWQLALVAAGIALPLLVQSLLYFGVPALQSWREQNVLPSPAPWSLLVGLGAMAPCALLALLPRRREVWHDRLLTGCWAIASLLLIYAPFIRFNHHLTLGLKLPLAALAVGGIFQALLARRLRALAVILLLALGAGSVWSWLDTQFRRIDQAQWPFYQPDEMLEAIDLVARQTDPSALVLAPRQLAPFVAAYAQRDVVWGHPHLTPRSQERQRQVDEVFDPQRRMQPATAEQLRAMGVTHIFTGREYDERALQQLPWPLQLISRHGVFALWRVVTSQ